MRGRLNLTPGITALGLCIVTNLVLASAHVAAFGYGADDILPFFLASVPVALSLYPVASLLGGRLSRRSAWVLYPLSIFLILVSVFLVLFVAMIASGGPHGSNPWSLPIAIIWFTAVAVALLGVVVQSRPDTRPIAAGVLAVLLVPLGFYLQGAIRTPDDLVLCLKDDVRYDEAEKISDDLFTLDGSSRARGYLPGVSGAAGYHPGSIRVLLLPGTTRAQRDELRAHALAHPKVANVLDIPSLHYSSDVDHRHRNVCKRGPAN